MTGIVHLNRDDVVASHEWVENPATLREDAIADEQRDSDLLTQLVRARHELRIGQQQLAKLEQRQKSA